MEECRKEQRGKPEREREREGRKEQRRIKMDNNWQQMSYTGICHPLGKIL